MSTALIPIGTTLGGYEVQALISSGGMSSVYRGFDPKLQRLVAIKVLSPEVAAQPGFSERFRQEALIIANLRHPNIVQVYDLGQQNGITYMVQELLPGPTLEAWMKDRFQQGTLPKPDEIIAIITQLASALDAAHAAGIVHRDIKPANAIWNSYGALVLTDFGVAKQLFGATNQTQVGTMLGTPNYLAPDQANGLPVTPASDIYSLGVVLYELITGDVPFHGTTMQVVLNHIQVVPPPMHLRRPDLPATVEAVVQRALAKDPAARFASAGELARALTQAWTSPAPPPPPSAQMPTLHSQPTEVWRPAPPRPAPQVRIQPIQPPVPPPEPVVPARPAPRVQVQPDRRSVAPPEPVSSRGGSRCLIPLLAVLVVLVLLAGAVLILRTGRQGIVLPVRTAIIERPRVRATVERGRATVPPAPQPTAVPTSAATTPTISTQLFDQLRALLQAGSADGRAGNSGQVLLTDLDTAQQAVTNGDSQQATQALLAMEKTLLMGVRTRTIDPTFARQVFADITAISKAYQLPLPGTNQIP